MNKKTGIVIMASGEGKRFGSNKLIEILVDKPLIRWIIDTTEDLFDRRIVVTRSIEVKNLCDSFNIECILHDLPYRSDTVRLGLESIMNDIDYCFFTPGDQPLIKRQSINNMIKEIKKYEDIIVRSRFNNIVGTPVGFPKKYFKELLKLPEGKGGNWVVNKYFDKVLPVKVMDEYELWDIDTKEDYTKIKNKLVNKQHIKDV